MSPIPPAEIQAARLRAHHQQLLLLEAGWDSYGARAPQPSLIQVGLQLALTLLAPDRAPPQLVPTNWGSVQLEWDRGNRSLEILILSPDRLALFLEDEATSEVIEREVALSSLPEIRAWVDWLQEPPKRRADGLWSLVGRHSYHPPTRP